MNETQTPEKHEGLPSHLIKKRYKWLLSFHREAYPDSASLDRVKGSNVDFEGAYSDKAAQLRKFLRVPREEEEAKGLLPPQPKPTPKLADEEEERAPAPEGPVQEVSKQLIKIREIFDQYT